MFNLDVSLEWDATMIYNRSYFFLISLYINDIEEGVTRKILKVAEDTKLFRKTKEIGEGKWR